MRLKNFSSTIDRRMTALMLVGCMTLQALCGSALADDPGERTYRSARIIEPEEGQVIQRPGTFSVIVDVEPNLRSGHRVQLFLDGEAHRIPNTEGRFSVSSTASGEHTLQVKVIDQGSGVLESSAVRTITVE